MSFNPRWIVGKTIKTVESVPCWQQILEPEFHGSCSSDYLHGRLKDLVFDRRNGNRRIRN